MTETQINKFLDSLDKQNWELKTLEEIATDIYRGNEITEFQVGSGTYPAVKNKDISSFDFNFKECLSFVDCNLIKNQKYIEKGDLIMSSMGALKIVGKTSAYLGNQKCLVGNDVVVLKHNENPVYLSFALSSNFCRKKIKELAIKSTVFHLYVPAIKKIKVPLPPRHIQDIVADLLDQWTRLDTELTTELTTELNARLEQWGYYKNNLITKIKNARIVTLGEIATSIFLGNGVTKKDLNTGNYPSIRYADIHNCSYFLKNPIHKVNLNLMKSPKYCDYGDLLICNVSENLKDSGKAITYLGNQKCVVGNHVVVLKHNQNPYFLSYALSTFFCKNQIKKLSRQSTVCDLYIPSIKQIQIPLPPLEKQEEIVKILDLFYELCQSVKTGIPALIENNKKQYEFIRDKIFET